MRVRPSLVSEELRILDIFNKKIESAISGFCKYFNDGVYFAPLERLVWNASDNGEVIVDDVRHIEGFSEHDYDIEKVFGYVIPMYQRQSMLITMYSIFESDLARMSEYVGLLGLGGGQMKKVRDSSKIRKYLNRLEEASVVGDEVYEDFDFLDYEVRYVRNAWVHDAGMNPKGKIPSEIDGIDYIYDQAAISNKNMRVRSCPVP